MSKPNPICVLCACEYVCVENDFEVHDVETQNFPSTYWYGDLFLCPICDHQLVTGFGAARSDRADMASSTIFAHSPDQKRQFSKQFQLRTKPKQEAKP